MNRAAIHFRMIALVIACCAVLNAGCRQRGWLVKRESDRSFVDFLPYLPEAPLDPSGRTRLHLRQYDLIDGLEGDPQQLLHQMQIIMRQAPSAETQYAYAELAYLVAQRLEKEDEKFAFDLYAASVTSAYLYLFDERFQLKRNAYDPQFRGACDLYNRSLDHALRLVNRHGGLKPGVEHVCNCGSETIQFRIESHVPHLRDDEFERFEFVSDYSINGLPSRYRSYGLGVPLIAVRRRGSDEVPIEQHYPPGLSVPVTAYLRIKSRRPTEVNQTPIREAVLELHDPLSTPEVQVDGRWVPLESDSTAPLAYFLDNLEYTDVGASTSGLFRPDESEHRTGLYMLEPYQPGKIPVLLVHGIWSTPINWMEMFNDLRSTPEIRDHFQFWFYSYPTGEPFVYSAADLRDQMAQVRQIVDPRRQEPALDQIVLVGHSMGGLIARLQAVDSGDLFWRQVAHQPLHAAKTDEATRQQVEKTFFFVANPSVRRIVTIATPLGGSNLSNSATQWLGRKLIEPPKLISQTLQKLHLENPELLKKGFEEMPPTSVEMLAPGSPDLTALAAAPSAPWVTYHNIIGRVGEDDVLHRVSGDGDGVVLVASARAQDATSEIVVEADHHQVHRHPRTVLEVRRILLDHLKESRPNAQQSQAHRFEAAASRFR